MRTNVVLDDALVEEAFALTGVRTKRELVHLARRSHQDQRHGAGTPAGVAGLAGSSAPGRAHQGRDGSGQGDDSKPGAEVHLVWIGAARGPLERPNRALRRESW